MKPSILFISILIFGTVAMAEESKMIFEPLPSESLAHMQKQRDYVSSLLKQNFENHVLTKSSSDFALLQIIVDSNLISSDQTWELQSLGVVFGDALANEIDGLAWWQVTDDYGTDPVLRYKESTLQIGVKTMISKRVEDDEDIDINHMYLWLKDFVETKAHEYK